MMPSIPQLLIVLVIVVLIFGAKRLRNLGGDLGSAVRGFKDAVKENPDGEENTAEQDKIESDDSVAARVSDKVEDAATTAAENKQA